MTKTVKVVTSGRCEHCGPYKHKVEEVAEEHDADVRMLDLDNTDGQVAKRTVEAFNLSHVPFTVVEKNGIEVDRFEGNKTERLKRDLAGGR